MEFTENQETEESNDSREIQAIFSGIFSGINVVKAIWYIAKIGNWALGN